MRMIVTAISCWRRARGKNIIKFMINIVEDDKPVSLTVK
jgi:hypothetical protein